LGSGKNRADDIERVRHVCDGQMAPSVDAELLRGCCGTVVVHPIWI
jgi:hypothetical protein